jgi:outer membrane immunogenic protein
MVGDSSCGSRLPATRRQRGSPGKSPKPSPGHRHLPIWCAIMIDTLLAYVTGGFAYGRVEHTANLANVGAGGFGVDNGTIGFDCDGGFSCFAGASSHTATGWTLGGGLEYALWQKWTVKAEYLYVSLNGNSVTETALSSGGFIPASFNANFSRTNFNTVRVGLNYQFH